LAAVRPAEGAAAVRREPWAQLAVLPSPAPVTVEPQLVAASAAPQPAAAPVGQPPAAQRATAARAGLARWPSERQDAAVRAPA
jgi:hypothetical protein